MVVRALEDVVSPRAPPRARPCPGYQVAGKTGTAQKVSPQGGYMSGQYVVSFVGFCPPKTRNSSAWSCSTTPRPAGHENYGGLVAAPIFASIAEQAMRYLNIEPTLPDPRRTPGPNAMLRRAVERIAINPSPAMQLKLLLSKVPTREVRGSLDVEITSICYDSRQAAPGALFVAMRGRTDATATHYVAASRRARRGRRWWWNGRRRMTRRRDLRSSRRYARAALADSGGVFLPPARAQAQAGRRHRHERQDDHRPICSSTSASAPSCGAA